MKKVIACLCIFILTFNISVSESTVEKISGYLSFEKVRLKEENNLKFLNNGAVKNTDSENIENIINEKNINNYKEVLLKKVKHMNSIQNLVKLQHK